MLITRRTFLKGAAASALVATAGVLNLDFDVWAAEQEAAQVELKGSFCNTCSSHCGMWIHVKNGRAWKVSGHEDHDRSRGKLCARAHGGIAWIYDPGRVRTPLKKNSAGEFEPITWEQASDEIGEKLRTVVANGDSQGIFWGHNPRQSGVFYGTRFMHALNSRTVVTHNAACNTAITCGFNNTIGRTPSSDLRRSTYLMCIGRNYGEGIRTSQATMFADAIAREGTKVVCVDPRLSASAALADEWVPIRPGTDLAFILAMCHVLIKEELYDKDFIEEHAEGFDKFLETIDRYTPEWAADITSISADTIRRLARELAANSPSCFVDPSWKGAFGANYANCTETVRAVAYINALLGSIGRPGGLSIGSSMSPGFGSLDSERHPVPPTPTTPRLDGAGPGEEFPLAPLPMGLPHNIAKKALAGTGEVKVGFIRHFNPVRTFPDFEHMRQGFENIEMLVVLETHMTETALCADYILPETSYAEREEVIENHGPTIAIRTVAVEKVYPETKSLDEIIPLLAGKAGVGQYFNFTLEELNRARLAPLGITLEEMRERGSMSVTTTPNTMNPVRFYNEAFAENGFDGVAGWSESAAGYVLEADQFRLLNVKQGYHSHNATANIPHLGQITKDYNSNRLWMNASRATALGISDGDWVEVSSSLATFRGQIKVTEKVHPDALVAPGGYGNRTPYFEFSASVGGINPNDLVPFQMEPISGHAMLQEVLVTVRRA
jgi:thiosulfate reductase/polysulfide reductase chain A